MSNKIYKCQLCYTDDHFNDSQQSLEDFLNHLITTHDSPKAKDMLATLEKFGGIKKNDK